METKKLKIMLKLYGYTIRVFFIFVKEKIGIIKNERK